MMKSFLRFLCLTLLGVFLQYGNIASADSNRSVGSPKGQFEVSSTGGAVYSVAIDAPKGIGKLQPNVSLTYNSQAGYGIVGYGTNILVYLSSLVDARIFTTMAMLKVRKVLVVVLISSMGSV